MTEAVEQLKSQARALSVPERADLAHFLMTSLEPEEEGVQEAWRAEIDRRVAEIRNGSAVGRRPVGGRSLGRVAGALPVKPVTVPIPPLSAAAKRPTREGRMLN